MKTFVSFLWLLYSIALYLLAIIVAIPGGAIWGAFKAIGAVHSEFRDAFKEGLIRAHFKRRTGRNVSND